MFAHINVTNGKVLKSTNTGRISVACQPYQFSCKFIYWLKSKIQADRDTDKKV
jgi:hypothetical protein